MKKLLKNWYICLIAALLFLQAAVFLIFRGQSYPQVHDNLDLFMAHFEAMKRHGLWFSHGQDLPILHGVSRDLFGSEFSLYNIFYILLPGIWAYLAGYAAKVAIGFCSFTLLAKEQLGERYGACRPLVLLCSCAFGLIPVFPAYGIAFTSLPLLLFFLLRLHRSEGRLKDRLPLYAGVFFYPLLSYFSYHGIFIAGWALIAILILWIRKKRFPLRLFAALILLCAGYICFEYRLFSEMLFSDTVSIRGSMEHAYLSPAGCLKQALGEFVNAYFHNQDSHSFVILWLAPAVLLGSIVRRIKKKEPLGLSRDPLFLLLLWILINDLLYGLYFFEPFCRLWDRLLKPLAGFNFSRSTFLNPLLWYGALLTALLRLWDAGKKELKYGAGILAAAALLAVCFIPQVYNDLYYTVYNQAYRILKQKDTDYLNYDEFYSTELFDHIREELDYKGEWCAAFGLHPAVLYYNGLSTLDGYLGLYPQEYKDRWAKVIAPALEGSPQLAESFNDFGARVYLFSGSDENTYAHTREIRFTDHRLLVDMNELRSLDCRYIFSRVELSNAAELGLSAPRVFTDPSSPYTIYVYTL
ncbi:MAG: hypothetical protein IK115_13365 [Lachnospiraceae bacterium]|nr:hypothetical protein [Lachnospiraceae bacterium]